MNVKSTTAKRTFTLEISEEEMFMLRYFASISCLYTLTCSIDSGKRFLKMTEEVGNYNPAVCFVEVSK